MELTIVRRIIHSRAGDWRITFAETTTMLSASNTTGIVICQRKLFLPKFMLSLLSNIQGKLTNIELIFTCLYAIAINFIG